MLKDGISVIVCCYNSAWIIERCLTALVQQIVPDDLLWEVVVVDNNCTDNTASIVLDFTKSHPYFNLRLVEEKQPGLLNARKKGIKEVSYSISIYCDDDNILSKDYVAGMYEVMSNNSYIGAYGGMGVPEFLSDPDPIIKEFLPCYACGSQDNNLMLFGAGLCIRTAVVKRIYETQHFYLSGRCGKKLLSGDDTELVVSILLRGYEKGCSDNLKFIHVLPSQRLTQKYLFGMYKGFSMAYPILMTMISILEKHSIIKALFYYFVCYIGIFRNILFLFTKRRKLLTYYYLYNVYAYHFWGWRKLHMVFMTCKNLKELKTIER